MGVFITMNPKYSGRLQLPESVSILFRPVSMNVTDLDLIVEILLLSDGFVTATRISKKRVKLFELA
jgi:hypothetical protein